MSPSNFFFVCGQRRLNEVTICRVYRFSWRRKGNKSYFYLLARLEGSIRMKPKYIFKFFIWDWILIGKYFSFYFDSVNSGHSLNVLCVSGSGNGRWKFIELENLYRLKTVSFSLSFLFSNHFIRNSIGKLFSE